MDVHSASVVSCARWSGWLRAALGCCLWVVPFLEGHAATIYVKLLVDEEEPAVERLWQQRLQTRLERASEIISQYCDIRFTTAGFGTWQSDDSLSELNRTLREFEVEVDPAPGQIAIGFSSQYRFQKGINGLGGTRGPLRSHILLRESARTVLEPERLEALVHELGHFLGAAHSGEKGSVMRPVMGDGQVRLKSFRIHFDPLNAQLIRLVGGEVSTLRVRRFNQLSPGTQRRLIPIYRQLAEQLPKDPAAPKFLEYLGAASPAAPKSPAANVPAR